MQTCTQSEPLVNCPDHKPAVDSGRIPSKKSIDLDPAGRQREWSMPCRIDRGLTLPVLQGAHPRLKITNYINSPIQGERCHDRLMLGIYSGGVHCGKRMGFQQSVSGLKRIAKQALHAAIGRRFTAFPPS